MTPSCLGSLMVCAVLQTAAAIDAPVALSRTNPLAFTDASGAVQTVRSTNDWFLRRSAILHAMQEVMGPLPSPATRCPLDPQTIEESDQGKYIRRLLSYQSEPGNRVQAYLLIPKGKPGEVFPAILALHQTHAEGFKVVVGLGRSPNDEYGVELVERGYVVLAPSYPLLAGYKPDLRSLGYVSGTMKAVWDNVRGMDFLEGLPSVRRGAFGAIGHSLGGHNAVFTGAFDERLKVIVSSCGLDSFRDYMDGKIKGWTSSRYMPRLLNYRLEEIPFDFYEVIGALAPRSCFLSAPLHDTNFKWRSVDAIAASARPVFELFGDPNGLKVEHPDCGHEFPPELRRAAYRLFDRHLKKSN